MSTEAMKLAVAKEALEKLAKLGNGDRYGNSIGNSIAMEALDKMAENARELGLDYMEGSAEQYEKELEQRAQQDGQSVVAYRSRLESGSYTYCNTAQFFDNAEPLYTTPPAPAQEPDPDELTIAYMSGVYEGKKAERKRIVNLLMIQHEAANGAHNYWKVAANLIQADVASDT